MPFRRGEVKGEIQIRQGQKLFSVAEEMKAKGLIVDVRNFLFWLRHKGMDRTLKAGTYRLFSGPSWDVAEQLRNGTPLYFKATILPGAWPQQPLGDKISSEEQLQFLSDDKNFPEPMRALLPQSPLSRGAFLLPDTYLLAEESLPELIQVASAAWWSRFGSRIAGRDFALRTAIIASLLQREALLEREYSVIAGVVENRLKAKMPLQIDATVIYAWHLEGTDLNRVYYRHLEIQSPYNTYLHRQLPPEPICVPSAAAWEGALSPQQHDYLYYVARRDGSHYFSRSYEEHQEAVQSFRK